MKKLVLSVVVSVIVFSSCKNNEDAKVNLMNFDDSLSYAIGQDIANNFKQSKLDSIDINILSKAMKDFFAEDTSIMTKEEVSKTLTAFSMKMRAEQEAKQLEQNKIQFKAELEAGQKFLEENAAKEGIITTESGLQYKVIKEGKGATPTVSDKVKVHYEGTLIDGTKFDSSYDRGEPAEFGVTQVIKGWTEALQLMKEGSIYELYIPYQLAYGERGSGSIKPFSTLIFKVELISIIKK
ncbi:MAG: FKBP-type peptidyl-prolyl cis-trans isomerase [Bacteroidales bacterium]|nr:FKBP-type peptidyl-prolyl cis-trans isomerase [Bacteroidales bacterium]